MFFVAVKYYGTYKSSKIFLGQKRYAVHAIRNVVHAIRNVLHTFDFDAYQCAVNLPLKPLGDNFNSCPISPNIKHRWRRCHIIDPHFKYT